jgi:hypothetical protein
MTVRVAFHFVADTADRNFVTHTGDSLFLAHDRHEKLRADVFMYYILREMNGRMATAVLDYEPSRDARIRFERVYRERPALESAFFYRQNERPRLVDSALNLVFRPNLRTRAPTAQTGYGSNRIDVFNVLRTYLRGSHDTWSVARTINHEFGHTQGLRHSFNCGNPCDGIDLAVAEECGGECVPNDSRNGESNCYGRSPRDLMMGYGTQLHLTVCELEHLWGGMLRRPRPYLLTAPPRSP